MSKLALHKHYFNIDEIVLYASPQSIGEFGGIWAKLNNNVQIVVASFVFSQIAVGTI